MRTAAVYFDLADTADERFDRPIEYLLVALIAFAPLALGAVQPWSEAIFIGGALAMAALLAAKLLVRPDVQFVRSWTYWPIAVFLLLTALQLVPLPAGLVRTISPATFRLKTELLSDLPGAAERLRTMTLSFYPEATQKDLRLIIALICIFVVVINCIRRVSQIRRLLGSIAIVAAVFAVIALIQDAVGATKIYGFIEVTEMRFARAGPFVNRGHFGQYLNLSIGASIGLALVLINQYFRRDNYTPQEISRKLRAPEMQPAWGLFAIVVASAAAVIFSLSRGAMLAASIAGLVTSSVLLTRKNMHGRGWVVFVLVLCVILAALLNFPALQSRLTESTVQMGGGRVEIWRDLVQAWKQFPLFGAGLGSFAVVFPMFDRSMTPLFTSHAENEYAQLLTETGVVGFVLVLAFLAIIVGALVRAVSGPMSPASSAATGLMYGLAAVLVHSFTDFGQHVPGVAVLTAVTCALILNLAQLRWRELEKLSTALPSRGWLWARVASSALIVLAMAFFARELYACIRADQAWQIARRIDRSLLAMDYSADNAEFYDVIEAAQAASSYRPQNVDYHYWLNFFRWKALTRVRDDETGRIMMLPERIESYRRVIDEIHGGRWLAPTHGPSLLLAYKLEGEMPDLADRAAKHLALAYRLRGPDPEVALDMGYRAIADRDVEGSMQYMRRAVQLDPNLRRHVTLLYVRDAKRPDIAMQLAGDDPIALNELASVLAKNPSTEALAVQTRQRSFELVRQRADDPNAPAHVLVLAAEGLVERQSYQAALPYFRRALNLEYGRTEWRMQMALALEQLGRNEEAVREARICLRQRSEMPAAKQLVARLGEMIE